MNKKVRFNSGGTFTITDKYYLSAGGEGAIYVNGGKAFKIYHDKTKVLPLQKIKELSVINDPSVITPTDIIYDASTGDMIGHVTNFVPDCEPLLKYFTKTFKQDNKISLAMLLDLIKRMHIITQKIHSANVLIVDYNELNVLIKNSNGLFPFYIDTDSCQTPGFKSTAVMNSIMDRKCSKMVNGHLNYNPTVLSDWFSFGVLSFWALTSIHPFRGGHPKYKPNQKGQQFDDGVSVFDPQTKLPPTVTPFNNIPKVLLNWYIDVFRDGNRSIPPLPDGTIPTVVPAPIVTIKGNNQVDVTQTASYGENIVAVIQAMGLNYVVTDKKIYRDAQELFSGCEKYKKVLLCPASDGTIVVATLLHNIVTFTDLIRQQVVGTINSSGMIFRNNCIYTVSNGKFVENKFTSFGNKIIHRVNEIENVSVFTTTIWDGCAIQNLLGKYYLVLPYAVGACFSKYLPQLDGYRIVAAKSERNVVVIIAEKKGKFDRFIVVFTKKDYTSFDVRKVEDVAYEAINFTTLENGLTLLLASPDELELFANNSNVNVITQPPFDADMPLFNTSDGAHFINGNSIHRIKKK